MHMVVSCDMYMVGSCDMHMVVLCDMHMVVSCVHATIYVITVKNYTVDLTYKWHTVGASLKHCAYQANSKLMMFISSLKPHP